MPTFTFTVTGKGPFPMHMLREEGCWSEDPKTFEKPEFQDDHSNVTHVVRMASGKQPNPVRWLRLGWTVRDITKS